MMSLMRRVVSLVMGGLLLAATGAAAVPAPLAEPVLVARAAAKLTTIRGVVESVSDTALLVGAERDGSRIQMSFAFDDKVVVMKQRKRIGVEGIQTGDPITVRYAEDGGQAVAKRIWVRERVGSE